MNDKHARLGKRVNRLATLLDGQFGIPGTRFRFGWDAVVGLIPGADLIMAFPGFYCLFQARRLGMPAGILSRMTGNLLIDSLVGLIPVAGDLFDVVFKANLRNARLFEKGLEEIRNSDVIDV